jgi:hypothetical protein
MDLVKPVDDMKRDIHTNDLTEAMANSNSVRTPEQRTTHLDKFLDVSWP